ncbi:MAG: helix-turn-helix domain-containing protein [Weeksellaceae bacterium]|nr:helix-turn-helix domain-containing protein [Weeksellaceae bacterium]
MSIGSKVKKHRESKGWSQEDLAYRLNVAQTTISSIESDKSVPNSILLNNIAKELEVDIRDLLEDSKTQINNIEKNEGVISFDFSTINMLSEKVIEQYEKRCVQYEAIIKNLEEQLQYWKKK